MLWHHTLISESGLWSHPNDLHTKLHAKIHECRDAVPSQVFSSLLWSDWLSEIFSRRRGSSLKINDQTQDDVWVTLVCGELHVWEQQLITHFNVWIYGRVVLSLNRDPFLYSYTHSLDGRRRRAAHLPFVTLNKRKIQQILSSLTHIDSFGQEALRRRYDSHAQSKYWSMLGQHACVRHTDVFFFRGNHSFLTCVCHRRLGCRSSQVLICLRLFHCPECLWTCKSSDPSVSWQWLSQAVWVKQTLWTRFMTILFEKTRGVN